MGIEVALAEIVNNRGIKFQPECVDACIKVLKRLDGKIEAIKDFYEDFLRTM
jgi:HD-GYP domain-containing protein (c-di-GMP phosphodiesterase class II)